MMMMMMMMMMLDPLLAIQRSHEMNKKRKIERVFGKSISSELSRGKKRY